MPATLIDTLKERAARRPVQDWTPARVGLIFELREAGVPGTDLATLIDCDPAVVSRLYVAERRRRAEIRIEESRQGLAEAEAVLAEMNAAEAEADAG